MIRTKANSFMGPVLLARKGEDVRSRTGFLTRGSALRPAFPSRCRDSGSIRTDWASLPTHSGATVPALEIRTGFPSPRRWSLGDRGGAHPLLVACRKRGEPITVPFRLAIEQKNAGGARVRLGRSPRSRRLDDLPWTPAPCITTG